jgi:hypothetical protein
MTAEARRGLPNESRARGRARSKLSQGRRRGRGQLMRETQRALDVFEREHVAA